MGLMQITDLDLCEIMISSDLKINDRLMPLHESHTPKFLKLFLISKMEMQYNNSCFNLTTHVAVTVLDLSGSVIKDQLLLSCYLFGFLNCNINKLKWQRNFRNFFLVSAKAPFLTQSFFERNMHRHWVYVVNLSLQDIFS